MRKNFEQILKEGKVNIKKEYKTLCQLFYGNSKDAFGYGPSLYEYIDENFDKVSFNGTAISLEDFNEEYGFNFDENKENIQLDDLVLFCEYFFNLVFNTAVFADNTYFNLEYYYNHINKVIEKIGYIGIEHDGITLFAVNNPAAAIVAEGMPKEVSYKTLMYYHHSMKGNISEKKSIISLLYEKLEPNKNVLEDTDKTLSDNLFFAYNNFNIRHNNIDPSNSSNYHKQIAEMKDTEIERIYDTIYELALAALLMIKNKEEYHNIRELKKQFKK